MSEEKTGINEALAKFQAEVPNIELDKTANITASRKYGYASLGNIYKTIRPLMYECGLFVTTSIQDLKLTVTVKHTGGESVSSSIMIKEGQPQDIGKQITYFTRYLVCALLAIVGDEDTDAPDIKSKWEMSADKDAEIGSFTNEEELLEYAKQQPTEVKTNSEFRAAVAEQMKKIPA